MVIAGEMPDGAIMTERCDPLSKASFHSVIPLGEQRFGNGRHGGRASPARAAQQQMVRRRHLLPKVINSDHGRVVGTEDIVALQRCDQICQLALRSLRETQRGRTMIQTPAVVIPTSSRGTASPCAPSSLKQQDRSLPATPPQCRQESTAGQSSADHGQINHLQTPVSCSDHGESEG